MEPPPNVIGSISTSPCVNSEYDARRLARPQFRATASKKNATVCRTLKEGHEKELSPDYAWTYVGCKWIVAFRKSLTAWRR